MRNNSRGERVGTAMRFRLPWWILGHEWRPRTSTTSLTGTVKHSLPTGRERGVVFGQPRWRRVWLRMRRWAGLAATFVLGTTIAASVMLWQPWQGSAAATSDLTLQRFLTSGEPAARAEQFIRTTFEERASESGIDLSEVTTPCETEDCNARTQKWIVRCTFGTPANLRLQVDDATGEVGGTLLTTKSR